MQEVLGSKPGGRTMLPVPLELRTLLRRPFLRAHSQTIVGPYIGSSST